MAELFQVIYNSLGAGHADTIPADAPVPPNYQSRFKGTLEECVRFTYQFMNDKVPFEYFLREYKLREANLSEADLSEANLEGVIGYRRS